ncbi:heat shock protein 9/12-domain-containing protein [Mycena capillaripes]|nr:heat shock protein 9/12-domain-containing protein [Mycena capillaripes]
MSDTGRQSMTDKAGAALKPDSQKSTTEQMGDHFKGTGDSIASTFQPQSEKSTTQKAGDTFSSNSNNNDDSLLNKAKNAVGMGEKK